MPLSRTLFRQLQVESVGTEVDDVNSEIARKEKENGAASVSVD
jgi:hypothetical protein